MDLTVGIRKLPEAKSAGSPGRVGMEHRVLPRDPAILAMGRRGPGVWVGGVSAPENTLGSPEGLENFRYMRFQKTAINRNRNLRKCNQIRKFPDDSHFDPFS